MVTQVAVEIAQFAKEPKAGLQVTKEKQIPKPGEGQVLVRVTLRPINPSDIFSITGLYAGFRPKQFPATPGLEGVGVVEKLGPGANRLNVGQRVVVISKPKTSGQGSWQQYLALDESILVPVADNVSDESAAQFLVNPATAYCFIEMVPSGKWLLQNAANSVLGKELIEMAKHRGIKTINLVRRQEAVDELLKLGADVVINASEEDLDLPAKVRELTGGEGVWAAFNPVAGAINAEIMKGLRDGGTCYVYGVMGGLNAEVPMVDAVFRGVECKGFWLTPYLDEIGAEQRDRITTDVMDMMSKGVFRPDPPSKKFPLEKAAEAIDAYFEFAGKGGKVMLEG